MLYYFAFLLVALDLSVAGWLVVRRRFRPLRTWLLAQLGVLLLYLPWLPIAWRQATDPPVPPWRSFIPLDRVAVEAWTALALGQSVQPDQVWPALVVAGILLGLGTSISAYQMSNVKSQISNLQPPTSNLLLATYTFAPLALIYLVSLVTPLYHVRYLFTYAPPFYILLGAGLAWLTRRAWPLAALAALVVLGGSAFSIRELHTNPRYAADDWRAAVDFIAERWRPGDVLLVNAGYAYTGFVDLLRRPYRRTRAPHRLSAGRLARRSAAGAANRRRRRQSQPGLGRSCLRLLRYHPGRHAGRPGARDPSVPPHLGAAHLRHGRRSRRFDPRLAGSQHDAL